MDIGLSNWAGTGHPDRRDHLADLVAIGLGRLPGDIVFQRGDTSFYFPMVTCIISGSTDDTVRRLSAWNRFTVAPRYPQRAKL